MRKLERLFYRMQDLSSDLETAQAEFLREAGWKYTCQTPGSTWLWEKEINGKTVQVGQPWALSMAKDDLDYDELNEAADNG